MTSQVIDIRTRQPLAVTIPIARPAPRTPQRGDKVCLPDGEATVLLSMRGLLLVEIGGRSGCVRVAEIGAPEPPRAA